MNKPYSMKSIEVCALTCFCPPNSMHASRDNGTSCNWQSLSHGPAGCSSPALVLQHMKYVYKWACPCARSDIQTNVTALSSQHNHTAYKSVRQPPFSANIRNNLLPTRVNKGLYASTAEKGIRPY